jgi:hypothetical protein
MYRTGHDLKPEQWTRFKGETPKENLVQGKTLWTLIISG